MASTGKHSGGLRLLFVAAGIAVVVVAGLIGYAAYHMYRQPAPSQPVQSRNGTAGWRSYTLKVEKLSFKYPPSWSVEDDTQTATGMDSVAINSPHAYFQVSIGTGIGQHGADPDFSVIGDDPINFGGQPDYLVYTSIEDQPTVVVAAYLSTSATDYTAAPAAKYAKDKIHAASAGQVQILVSYNADSGAGETVFGNLAATERDPNYITAKQIIASMRY